MTTQGEATALPPVPPDAPAIADELNCPLCGYDLRGLPSQRCPECGHAFDPDELRAAKLEERDWFFEHARRRRVRAFFATAIRTLRPFYFWTRVGAAHRLVASRLDWWAFLWFVMLWLIVVGSFTIAAIAEYTETLPSATLGQSPVRFPPSNTAPWRVSAPPPITFLGTAESVYEARHLGRDLPLLIAILAWPVVTITVFRFFGLTLRRAGFNRGHLARCVLYPWPIVATPMVFAVALTMFFELNSPSIWRPDPMSGLVVGIFGRSFFQIAQAIGLTSIATLTITMAILLSTLHLIAAHVRYLRLPQAIAQALLIQAVTWLFILAVIHLGFGA